MKTPRRALFAAVLWTALGLAGTARRPKAYIVLGAWDPANALVELSKDFTKQSGIEMKFRIRPLDELCRSLPQRAESPQQAV